MLFHFWEAVNYSQWKVMRLSSQGQTQEQPTGLVRTQQYLQHSGRTSSPLKDSRSQLWNPDSVTVSRSPVEFFCQIQMSWMGIVCHSDWLQDRAGNSSIFFPLQKCCWWAQMWSFLLHFNISRTPRLCFQITANGKCFCKKTERCHKTDLTRMTYYDIYQPRALLDSMSVRIWHWTVSPRASLVSTSRQISVDQKEKKILQKHHHSAKAHIRWVRHPSELMWRIRP